MWSFYRQDKEDPADYQYLDRMFWFVCRDINTRKITWQGKLIGH